MTKSYLSLRRLENRALKVAQGRQISIGFEDVENPNYNANDAAVMRAYGFDANMTEDDIVAELMKMYQKKVEELENG